MRSWLEWAQRKPKQEQETRVIKVRSEEASEAMQKLRRALSEINGEDPWLIEDSGTWAKIEVPVTGLGPSFYVRVLSGLGWQFESLRHEQQGMMLDQGQRQVVNGLLLNAGFDGNGRFDSIGQAINRLTGILEGRGIELDDVPSADIFSYTTPPHLFDVAFTNRDDPFSPTPITNSRLSVSWYQHESGTWEILAHLT